MREAAKQLKQRYSKIPMFMIYLFLLVKSKKFISTFIIVMYISGILAMILGVVTSIIQINRGIGVAWIMLCICTLLLLAFSITVIKDFKQSSDSNEH